jgi:spermidine/putrescine transport system permease protein
MKRFFVCGLYLLLLYGFIFLPVIVLVVFSFQAGRFPIPPFQGFSLKWHEAVLGDEDLMVALFNSLLVATVSSLVSLVLGFLAARAVSNGSLPFSKGIRGLITAPISVSYLVIGLGLRQSQPDGHRSFALDGRDWSCGHQHTALFCDLSVRDGRTSDYR